MISQSRYVTIVSGVGAGVSVAQRKLILRLITQNAILPPGIVAEFSSADNVGAYFGVASEEYARAQSYFAFISKAIVSPKVLSFARWASIDIAPMIVGDALTKTISQFAGVSAGTLTLVHGTTSSNVTGINLSTATDLTTVASLLQVAIRAIVPADSEFTSATVTFNTNTNQFVLTGSITGTGNLACTPTGSATDLSQLLGWATSGSVRVPGQTADTPAQAVSKSAAISNNFGSFAYCTPSTPLTNAQITDTATWNDGQNNMYVYSVPTSLSNLGTLFALVKGYSGCALNVLSTTMPNDYVEQSNCEILAATDFTQPAGAQGYMYYQFANRNIVVSDDATADVCDAARGNYIGVTQSAGQQLAFYQRGTLCGGSTAAVDMNVYANEMWLKSAIAVDILQLFLDSGSVPADTIGAASILGVMQPTLTLALTNGTFSVGKTLSAVQQQYITANSGDSTAWRQVQNLGYWLTISFSSYVNDNNGLTEWKATYKLFYSKGDLIRLVEGTDVLI